MASGMIAPRSRVKRRGYMLSTSKRCQWWLLNLISILSALWVLITEPVALAQTCPTLTPGLCSIDANCNGGKCERGVCKQCPSGKIGELCQANDVFLNLGNVVVTQAGLDFAPIQYFKPLNDAYEDAKAAGLSATAYVGPCTEVDGDSFKSFKVHINALTPQNFARSDLLQETIRFQIIPGGVRASATGSFIINKARLDLWGGARCCPCEGANCRDTLCPQVCSKTDGNDWIDFNFEATVSADIMLSYSNSVQGIIAQVENVQIVFDDSSLGANLNCPTSGFQFISNLVKSYFESMKGEIGPTLLPGLTSAFTQTANRIASRYQGVQSYSPFTGTSLLYKVVNLTIQAFPPRQYISADVQAKLIYTHFHNAPQTSCRINVTYADPSSDRTLLPPTEWSPVTKRLTPSGLYSPILAGNRMTRSFFNAVVWARFQDPLERHRTFVFTAGNGVAVTTELQMSVPVFKIPNDGGQTSRLKVAVNGNFKLSCTPTRPGVVLAADFTQLDSAFQLRYDDTPPDPSIAFQVVPGAFDLQSLSNIASQGGLDNATLLRSALVGAMNFKVSSLDAFLLEKGNGVLVLPEDLQQSFPDAQLNIVSQSGAIPNESGYIEMINRCACSSSRFPIENQGIDGVVNPCPVSLLNKNYCKDLGRRRRRLSGSSSSNSNNKATAITMGSSSSPFRRFIKTSSASQSSELVEVIGERRQLTPQQEADLTTVLGSLGTLCVTKSPTATPTTARPTKEPTRRPTRRPTTFEGIELSADSCEEKNGCFYQRDVLFFVCRRGFVEVKGCRNENSDVYCCPGESSSGVSMNERGWRQATSSIVWIVALWLIAV